MRECAAQHLPAGITNEPSIDWSRIAPPVASDVTPSDATRDKVTLNDGTGLMIANGFWLHCYLALHRFWEGRTERCRRGGRPKSQCRRKNLADVKVKADGQVVTGKVELDAEAWHLRD